MICSESMWTTSPEFRHCCEAFHVLLPRTRRIIKLISIIKTSWFGCQVPIQRINDKNYPLLLFLMFITPYHTANYKEYYSQLYAREMVREKSKQQTRMLKSKLDNKHKKETQCQIKCTYKCFKYFCI